MPKPDTEPGNFPGSTDVVVFDTEGVDEAGVCWYCDKPTYLLAGPDHAPRDGNAHHACLEHIEPGAVVQKVDAWPFKGTGVRLTRRCGHCKAFTPNKVYCSVSCRKNALYPDWEARRAEVLQRRSEGESLRHIAQAMNMSEARASAICRTAGVSNGTAK